MTVLTIYLFFLQEFLGATQKYYQADLKEVDFIGAAEACRGEINSWVEQQTESENVNMIQNHTKTNL